MRRQGFTLIEVMMALVILGVTLVSIARYNGQFLHTVSTSSVRTVAAEVARERVGLIDMDPSYNTLGATWGGTQTGFPGYPNMVRTTTVNRVTGTAPPRDYTVITVQVTEPTMGPAIDVTTVVAQP
jgi:prepilin-type N-terminal cleavage/methylation domain-containing protein